MLTVDANVAGAAIVVDGVPVGRSPLSGPLRVARSKHQVTADARRVSRVKPRRSPPIEKARVSVQRRTRPRG